MKYKIKSSAKTQTKIKIFDIFYTYKIKSLNQLIDV